MNCKELLPKLVSKGGNRVTIKNEHLQLTPL